MRSTACCDGRSSTDQSIAPRSSVDRFVDLNRFVTSLCDNQRRFLALQTGEVFGRPLAPVAVYHKTGSFGSSSTLPAPLTPRVVSLRPARPRPPSHRPRRNCLRVQAVCAKVVATRPSPARSLASWRCGVTTTKTTRAPVSPLATSRNAKLLPVPAPLRNNVMKSGRFGNRSTAFRCLSDKVSDSR